MSNASGYTTGRSTAQMVTTITGANAAANVDSVSNALSGLAVGQVTPVGTPVLIFGVLVVCTTGYPSTPVFAYDSTTIS